MEKFNYHTHTKRCHHAYGEDEEYVISAIKNGYRQIGFSDHAPLLRPEFHTRNRMHKDEFEDYISSITSLKEKYKDQIDIKLGVEAEAYPEAFADYDEFFKRLDYVILSIHGRDYIDCFKFAHHNSDEEILEYGRIAEKVLPMRKWLYFAHPDYFLRNQTDFTEACVETTHRLCKLAVEHDIIFEFNVTGMYYKMVNFKQGDFFFYPHRLFWQIVAQYPIKVCLGLDAHDPDKFDSDKYYQLTQQYFGDLNLNFITNPLL